MSGEIYPAMLARPAPRAVVVGFGEINSPRGLIERKVAAAVAALEREGVSVEAIGPVADDPDRQQELAARERLVGAEFDLLVVCIAGWIPSQTVINVVDAARAKPMVLWGLAGETVDGRLVTTADQAGTTALRQPMEALGYRFVYVTDTPGSSGHSAPRVAGLAQAAATVRRLRSTRIGMVGYRDMHLYATLLDHTRLRRSIGPEIETFDLLEVTQRMEAITEERVASVVAVIQQAWVFDRPLEDDDPTLDVGVRMYLALEDKVEEASYDAISIVDVYGAKKLMSFPPGMVLALLADLGGVASIPENDGPGAVTQTIVRHLTGQVGAYFEFYEFLEDRLLVGVPDYVPAEVVDGDVHVVPWPGFGGLRGGLLNVSKVKTGPVTLCRLGPDGDGFRLHVAVGDALSPRSWEEAGWDPPAPQLPSVEIELRDTTVDQFAQQVLGQHYILAYGDHREALRGLCRFLDVRMVF